MQGNNISILCTRPLTEQLIQKAADNDICIEAVPFIETQTISSQKPMQQIASYASQEITAVFTSMNAVQAVTEKLAAIPPWTIFCMGGITKEYVFKFFGESSVAATAKNATALAEKILHAGTTQQVVFFCGDHRLDELPETLGANNIHVEEVVVYTTIETPVFIEKDYDGVIFFSPSAVHSFFSMNTVSTNVVLFSIGKTTTATIQSYCTNPVITSEWPGKEPMIDQVIHFFDTIKQAND